MEARKVKTRDQMSPEERREYILDKLTHLSNQVYQACVETYEIEGEFRGFLYGNGHHMAQKLAAKAQILFLNRLVPEDQDLVLPHIHYYRDKNTCEVKEQFEHFGF